MRAFAILLAIASSTVVFIACTSATPNNDLGADEDNDDDDDDDDDDDTGRGSTTPGKPTQTTPPPPPVDSGTDAFTSTATPQQTCMDTADVVAKAAQRCGDDYQDNYDAFIEAATGGGTCADITTIRDEASLRGECFTYFSVVPCANISDPPPGSCVNQLQ